eukprot:2606801-Prymnesium_polylepis.1
MAPILGHPCHMRPPAHQRLSGAGHAADECCAVRALDSTPDGGAVFGFDPGRRCGLRVRPRTAVRSSGSTPDGGHLSSRFREGVSTSGSAVQPEPVDAWRSNASKTCRTPRAAPRNGPRVGYF